MASPADWYSSLPPVCKTWGTALFGVTLGFTVGLVNPVWMYLDYDLVFKKFQVWRLLTSFFFAGKFSFPFAMQLLILAQFGVKLEKASYAGRTADFLFMLFFGMLAMLPLALLLPFFNFPFLCNSLIFMVIYMWSRNFPNDSVGLMGFVQIPGFYVPWAYLFMDLIFGNNVFMGVLGIVVGHLYYFLVDIYPQTSGTQLLTTPIWVHDLVARWARAAPQLFSQQQAQVPAPTVQRLQLRRPTVGAPTAGPSTTPAPAPTAGTSGAAFGGRSYRLDRD